VRSKWFTVVRRSDACRACLSIAISFRSMRRKSRSVASVLAYKPLGHDYLKNTRFYFEWLASCVFRQFLHAFMPRFLSNIYTRRSRCSREHVQGQRRILHLAAGFSADDFYGTNNGYWNYQNVPNTRIVAKMERRFHDSYLFPRDGKPDDDDRSRSRNVTSRNSMRIIFKAGETNSSTCQENSSDFSPSLFSPSLSPA